MITREKMHRSARMAGQVVRYHTWPMIRRETVAEHSWHVLRIYIQTFGLPLPSVGAYIVLHDCGEMVTGDPPFPVKQNNPALKSLLDDMDDTVILAMTGNHLPALAPSERLRVKACDLIDMWEVGMQEMAMGNKFAQPIISGTRESLGVITDKMGPGDARLVYQYIDQEGLYGSE